MVSVRRRKRKKGDRFVVDYRDSAGIRRLETCLTRAAADNLAAQKTLASQQAAGLPSVDVHITVKEYAARWVEQLALNVKPTTRRTYTSIVDTHIVPALGWVKLRRLTSQRIRDLLGEKLDAGKLAPSTVRNLRATLRAMLTAAVDDGVLQRNPAAGLGRKMRRLQQLGKAKQDVRALTVEQLAKFLEVARTNYADFHPMFFVLARTGLRLGEALGLEWGEVDTRTRELWVRQTLAPGKLEALESRLDTPKSNRERRVDLNVEACRVLDELRRRSLAEGLARGEARLPRFVFNRGGQPLDGERVRAAFARVLHAAGLPEHFTPHALRHSFAIHLLQRNTPIVYVKEQLGHSSITVTVDVYGRWLPTGDKRYVDALDEPEKTDQGQAAEAVAGAGNAGQAPAAAVANGAPGERSPKATGDRLVTNLRVRGAKRAESGAIRESPSPAVYSSSLPEGGIGARHGRPSRSEG